MANTEIQHLDALLHDITQQQGEGFTYDKVAMEQDVQQNTARSARLAIKVLTILGGLLASGTFLGFIGVAGLYDSPIALVVLGIAFLVGAEWLIRSKKDATADSIGVSLNIIGYLLLAMGTGQQTESTTAVASVLAMAAALVLLFSESAICTFLAVLVLNCSLLTILFTQKVYNLAHVLVALLALVLTYLSLNEAKLIAASPRVNLKYSPVKMGVAFSLLITLGLFVHQKFFSTHIEYFWVSGLILIGCFLFLVYRVLKEAAITSTKTQVIFYTCCILLLAPTVNTPSVSGALLVLLSSFYLGHKPGFWVGLLALVYFVILYYYDLNMTLLAKSGVLVASGLLFLGGFVLLNRFLKSYAD